MLKKLKHQHYLLLIVLILIIIAVPFIYHFSTTSNEENDNTNVTGTALVTVIAAQTSNFSPTISAYGTLTANPTQTQTISIQGTGVIKVINVMPYTRIKKGQKLIEIGPTPDVEASLENARTNLKRQEALRKEYLATNADVQAAQTTLTSLQAQYGNGNKWIIAPSDGVVGTMMIQPGQILTGGSPLLNFTKNMNIGASLGVTVAEQPSIKIGDTVNFYVVNNPELRFNGKVTNVATQLNDQSGLIDVGVALNPNNNLQNLIINTPVQAEIATKMPQARILLPRDAVLYQGNQAYVYIDDNNVARYRNVTVAGENDQEVAIEEGIRPGELIVTTGNYELQDGMPLAIQGGNS